MMPYQWQQMRLHFMPWNITAEWNVLRQTAASRCEGSPTFQGLTPPPSSPWRWGQVSPWDVREPSHLATVVYLRTFHLILLLQKLQDFKYHSSWTTGTAVAQWLRCCATNCKVAGSIPGDVIGIFHWHNPSDRTMALGSTQPLTEMSTRSISWGKDGRCIRLTTLQPSCANVT